MPALKKFTTIDPTERVNLSLRLSTRAALEQYRLFYQQSYDVPVERGELVEEVLRSFFDADVDFARFQKRMTAAEKASVDKALGLDREPVAPVPAVTAGTGSASAPTGYTGVPRATAQPTPALNAASNG